jgi:hypothetical protein
MQDYACGLLPVQPQQAAAVERPQNNNACHSTTVRVANLSDELVVDVPKHTNKHAQDTSLAWQLQLNLWQTWLWADEGYVQACVVHAQQTRITVDILFCTAEHKTLLHAACIEWHLLCRRHR